MRDLDEWADMKKGGRAWGHVILQFLKGQERTLTGCNSSTAGWNVVDLTVTHIFYTYNLVHDIG